MLQTCGLRLFGLESELCRDRYLLEYPLSTRAANALEDLAAPEAARGGIEIERKNLCPLAQ